VQWDEGGGRIMLGDKARSCMIILSLLCCRVLDIGFQLECLIYTHIIDHMYLQFWLAPDLLECNYCTSYESIYILGWMNKHNIPITF
jgi:hypothetical protein